MSKGAYMPQRSVEPPNDLGSDIILAAPHWPIAGWLS